MKQVDICIAGGGIVGLTLAALLAREKLSIAVLEPAPPPPPISGRENYALRVSAINLASMRIFAHLGVAEDILKIRASGYRHMHIWDANSSAQIQFDADNIDHEYLGYIIENDLIVKQLYDNIKVFDNVTIYPQPLQNSSRNDTGIAIKLQDTELQAQLLVGADGQHSRVRSLAGIATDMGVFNQAALVCRIHTERAHQQTAFQCFHHSGPIAYLPLADGSTSIVWSCDSDKLQPLLEMSEDAFSLAVENAMQSALGAVELVSPRASFDLAQQHARRYIESRVALVGDAAHRTHPLAGLGANLGLQDAAVLAQTMQQAISLQRPYYSYATLRKYERMRKHQNALVLGAMQSFKTGFGSRTGSLAALREFALNSADSVAPLKSLITELATGLSGDLPEICK